MGLTLDQVHKVNELAKTLKNTGFAANMDEAAKIAENILFDSGLEKRQDEPKAEEVKITEPVKKEIDKIKWEKDIEKEPEEKIKFVIKNSSDEAFEEEPISIDQIEPVKEEQKSLSNFDDFDISKEKEKTLKELFEEKGEIVEEPELAEEAETKKTEEAAAEETSEEQKTEEKAEAEQIMGTEGAEVSEQSEQPEEDGEGEPTEENEAEQFDEETEDVIEKATESEEAKKQDEDFDEE